MGDAQRALAEREPPRFRASFDIPNLEAAIQFENR